MRYVVYFYYIEMDAQGKLCFYWLLVTIKIFIINIV